MKHSRLEALGRVLIIVNPVAQSGAAAGAAERLKRFLTMYCHREAFDIAHTERPRHATEIAAAAAEYDTVLALGGDGVVHEVANGLMRIDSASRPTLGVIPVGSGNDFARTLGLTDIVDVKGTDFSALLSSEPEPIDMLRVTYVPSDSPVPRRAVEYATQTISFGLDAAIAIDTHDMRKLTGLSGTPLYMASGLKAFGRCYRDFPVRVRFDDADEQHLRTIIFAIQNGPTYGSGFEICPNADATDGMIDICYAVGPAPRAAALPVFLSAKNGGHIRNKRIHLRRVESIEIDFAEPAYPIQLDGEQLRAKSMRVEVVPQAITVLTPRRHPKPSTSRPDAVRADRRAQGDSARCQPSTSQAIHKIKASAAIGTTETSTHPIATPPHVAASSLCGLPFQACSYSFICSSV